MDHNYRLPCEEIHINCTVDVDFPRSCNMEYHQMKEFDQSKFLSFKYKDSTCYWLQLSHILNTRCSGTCYDNFTFHNYTQTWNVNIRINTSNLSKHELYSKCSYRFGTIYDTNKTLLQINVGLETVLGSYKRRIVYNI
eukprot:220640_1